MFHVWFRFTIDSLFFQVWKISLYKFKHNMFNTFLARRFFWKIHSYDKSKIENDRKWWESNRKFIKKLISQQKGIRISSIDFHIRWGDSSSLLWPGHKYWNIIFACFSTTFNGSWNMSEFRKALQHENLPFSIGININYYY